jgi:hypothetical protein
MIAAFILIGTLIFAFSFTHQVCYAQWKKRVLVLHSYHQGLEWTDNITRGIQSSFSPYQKQYEIHYEYLDTKRNTGQAYTKQMVNFITAQNRQVIRNELMEIEHSFKGKLEFIYFRDFY